MLHVACRHGLASFVKALLNKGANPNAQTLSGLSSSSTLHKQTPLHLAIENTHKEVVQVFLDFKGTCAFIANIILHAYQCF